MQWVVLFASNVMLLCYVLILCEKSPNEVLGGLNKNCVERGNADCRQIKPGNISNMYAN